MSGLWRDPDGLLWRVRGQSGSWWIRQVQSASAGPSDFAPAPRAWLRTFLAGCTKVEE